MVTLKYKIIILVLDIIVISILTFLSDNIVSTTEEPLFKIIIVVISYIFAIYTFNGYKLKLERDKFLYVILLIALFATLLSTITTFFIYFKPFGRKVYILNSFLIFIYLYVRGKFIVGTFSQKNSDIYLISSNSDINLRKDFQYIFSNNISSIEDKIKGNDIVVIDHKSLFSDVYLHHLLKLKLKGFAVYTITAFYEKFLNKVPLDLIDDYKYFLQIDSGEYYHNFFKVIKRSFDIALSVIILSFFSPFFAIISLLIRLESKGPAIFKQMRTGFHGENFVLYKFRTMVDKQNYNEIRFTDHKDERFTKLGKFLRRYRIDEFPQFFNVLKGDMSIIGPRPERPEIDQNYENSIPFYTLRYFVKPGITGWAQVNYIYTDSLDTAKEKLQYDLFYIKRQSLLLDFRIILKTINTVFLGKGR